MGGSKKCGTKRAAPKWLHHWREIAFEATFTDIPWTDKSL